MDRQHAQQRIERIDAFLSELGQLERDGVLEISSEQRTKVVEYHRSVREQLAREFDVDTSESQVRLSLAMKVASALGGLAFCIALGLLVERYWALMSTWIQVILLIAAPLAATILADFAAHRERTLYFTSLLSLVALAAFFVDLKNLGDIFSLAASPVAITACCALALMFAYRYRLKLQLLVGLVLLLTLVPMWVFYLSGYDWMNSFEGAELIIVASLVLGWRATKAVDGEFTPVMRGVAACFILLSVLTLSKWGRGSFLPLDSKTIESIYTILCFVVSGFGVAIGIQRRWDETMILSSICFGGFLFVKMYDWLWDYVPAFVFFALIGLISLLLLYAFRRLRYSGREQVA